MHCMGTIFRSASCVVVTPLSHPILNYFDPLRALLHMVKLGAGQTEGPRGE